MKLVYPAIFSPLENSEGYCVTVPDLPGCVTQGDNLADAIFMATDASSGWVLDELEDGNEAPIPSEIDNIIANIESNEFVNLLALDIDSYAEKFGQNAVRKNCTIPAWLNTVAEKNNINFSNLLQKALQLELNIQ